MHLTSRFGPKASSALLFLLTQGVAQTIPSPNLDISSLGQVALAGNFDSISLYSFPGQQQGFNSNGSSSILRHLQSGAYQALASTDANIEAMCPFVLRDGTVQSLVVGGNFTSIGGVNSRSVAFFELSTSEITAIDGLQGTVSALLCDRDTETVYVGGTFETANSSNAIAINADRTWVNLPFGGFDAPVTSIVRAPSGNVVFGGSFTGLHNMNGTSTASAQHRRESQAINLSSATLLSGANSSRPGLGNPRNILCPPNNTTSSPFLLRDDSPGYWQANLRFGFEPSKLRLYNTNRDGRGTRTWRFTALPLDGIMNFTYTDPSTGNLAACDSTCPLVHNSSIAYQDFYFVNRVGMDSFRIDISDWYGAGAGLEGIEIFQNEIFTYAVNAFNEPSCSGSPTLSEVSGTGPWYTTPSRQTVLDYMSAVVGPTSVNTTSIVFEPDVQTSGNYSVIVYTPGCIQDSSCSARAIVSVTGTLTTDGGTTFSTRIFQTNDYDKYDQVYQGTVDASSSSFRPRVTITPSGLQNDQLIVASRVRFALITSSGGLNGLFEYDPNRTVVDIDFSKSAINSAGMMLQPDAHVQALAVHDQTLYAAGRFSDDSFRNIMAFTNNNASSLPSGGLNDAVADLTSLDDYLYVAGNFTGTSRDNSTGLRGVAAFQYSTSSWVPLGAGVNGAVERVEPLELNVTNGSSEIVIAFSGSFTQIESYDSSASIETDGLAIWVPSQNNWLQNLNGPQQALQGQLCTTAYLPNGTWFGAGTLASQGQAISGVAGLTSNDNNLSLQNLPLDIQSTSPSQALTADQNITGVITGAYYNNQGRNVTIFAGHFSANSTTGSSIDNLLFLNGSRDNEVTGLPTGIDSDSTFLVLAVHADTLMAGGSVTGNVNDARINGLVLYDLQQGRFRDVQPAALVGENVIVNAIVAQPNQPSVYVGGTFTGTSQDLSCTSVCMYDTSMYQWNTVGSGLNGTVRALYWSSDKTLIAAGDLSINGNSTSLATYNTDEQMWSVTDGYTTPGPITAFAPATANANRIWAAGTASNGSTYLVEVGENNNSPVVDAFGPGTTIRGLQVMPLTENHGSTRYFDNDQALLVTGQLNVTGFGYASAALFNGTTMQPLILASTSDGSPGSISQLVSSNTNTLRSPRRGHSRGITILVALCAALGTIFLIILIGLIVNRIQRRRAGYTSIPNTVTYADKNSNINRVPPERLFGSLGQRTRAAPTV